MALLNFLKKKKPSESAAKTKKAAPTAVAQNVKDKQVSKKPEQQKKDRVKKDDTKEAFRVLLRPIVTEKASTQAMLNQYAFEVSPRTNKIEVSKAIRHVYGVQPKKVNIVNVSGKYIRYGKSEGMTKRWKKAIVILPEGQKLDIHEGRT